MKAFTKVEKVQKNLKTFSSFGKCCLFLLFQRREARKQEQANNPFYIKASPSSQKVCQLQTAPFGFCNLH